jgi:5-methylcytosine-specific restriction endonuclease McrA
MRRWRRNHRETHAAATRQRYARDPEAFQRMVDASPNRAAVRKAVSHRRRTRVVLGGPSFTAAEWITLVAAYGGRCAYCGDDGPLQADHRVSLARGGTNSIENILPACASCNAKKHLMTEEEFRARLAQERHDDLQS